MACRQYPDPYVLNSKGNVLASLGRWKGDLSLSAVKQSPGHAAHPHLKGTLACRAGLHVIVIESSHKSTGVRCAEARQDYLRSAAGFQKAAGFKDRDGSSASRLDGGSVHHSMQLRHTITAWEEGSHKMCATCLLCDVHSTCSVLTAGSTVLSCAWVHPFDVPHAGAIVASSNAALALVQLGDEPRPSRRCRRRPAERQAV